MEHVDVVWPDGDESVVRFADRDWRVKASAEPVGPGPNRFSAGNVSVDRAGRLSLSIAPTTTGWSCAEVIGVGHFGYGTYTWTLTSDVESFEPPTVLGLFTWSDDPAQANRELDIEFSRWGSRTSPVRGGFTVQRSHPHPPVTETFTPGRGRSEHTLAWSAGRARFRSTFGPVLREWTYSGPDVPTPGGAVAPRMNLWLFRGASLTRPVTIVVDSFTYLPAQ